MAKQKTFLGLYLIGGNYPVFKDIKGRTVCEVPWQKDRETTIKLAERMMDEYQRTGALPLGPAPMKVRMKFAGYRVLHDMRDGEIVLVTSDGQKEVWFANLHHANPGLIYRNTHLEFARTFTPEA